MRNYMPTVRYLQLRICFIVGNLLLAGVVAVICKQNGEVNYLPIHLLVLLETKSKVLQPSEQARINT